MGGSKRLKETVVFRFSAGFIVIGSIFFLSAGTFDYWEAWLYCAIIMVPMLFVVSYLLKKDPALLERRMRLKEKGSKQKKIVGVSALVFFIGFLLPGLDHRFGWSHMPAEVAIAADVLVFLGYVFTSLVLRENSYASRVIEVEKGQKVISTGPYALVRHPMYLGMSILILATPIALGSYWALLAFLPIPPMLALRLLNEEEVLMRELPGYGEYRQKVRFRLIPFIW
jgi:protein-S-isoprenylcysteine O-methyltransferase Ste14